MRMYAKCLIHRKYSINFFLLGKDWGNIKLEFKTVERKTISSCCLGRALQRVYQEGLTVWLSDHIVQSNLEL